MSTAPADTWAGMRRRADITLGAGGSFTHRCLAGYIYSFTSTTGQAIMTPPIPASQTFQLPYRDEWTRQAPAAGTITAWIKGQQVARVTDSDPNYASGIAGIETDAFRGTWSSTQFKDFSVSTY